MNIPLFTQTVQQFFGSKTNYAGLTLIVYAIYGLITGDIDQATAMTVASNGVAILGGRDAIAKLFKK